MQIHMYAYILCVCVCVCMPLFIYVKIVSIKVHEKFPDFRLDTGRAGLRPRITPHTKIYHERNT